MTYAIQQFHATRYVTVATADSLSSARAAQSAIKRKAPDLPTRILKHESKIKQEETALNPIRG